VSAVGMHGARHRAGGGGRCCHATCQREIASKTKRAQCHGLGQAREGRCLSESATISTIAPCGVLRLSRRTPQTPLTRPTHTTDGEGDAALQCTRTMYASVASRPAFQTDSADAAPPRTRPARLSCRPVCYRPQYWSDKVQLSDPPPALSHSLPSAATVELLYTQRSRYRRPVVSK